MTDRTLAFSRDGRFFRRENARCLIRGITYGPFQAALGGGEASQRDLDHIVGLGFNALRVFERPGAAFLSACRERRLAVFVSLKWESNTDFRDREGSIVDRLRADVQALRDADSVAGYFIGNEIPAILVRWMGWERVRAFLERLFQSLQAADATRLYAYANYPSTEYLQPRNGDFAAYNIYLEERAAVRRYLRRLHHLAEHRPLVVSEFGLDSMRHGEGPQADTLAWLTEEIFESGAAGAFLFSYTDDWYNGGRQVSDWGFGLVTAQRSPKPSAERVAGALRSLDGPRWPGQAAHNLPRVSVIVCTYNGHSRLPACLASLAKCDYPKLEVVVVDDGSNPGIEAIVSTHAAMRMVRQNHAGLSAARNRGVQETKGDILAFTDDDCEPDPDWIWYLVKEFSERGVDACGGPNIAPEAKNLMERCIQLAPGNPSHVLLDDFRAEHLPGCNLAVTREAFLAIGGFCERYRVAGDDVDFCWRLQFGGRRLGFTPNAVVWHHRRTSWLGFLKQQIGYGRAEALLHWDHPEKYSRTGGTDWNGTVYMPSAARHLARPVIYFGQDGLAPFQVIYNERQGLDGALVSLVRSFSWLALAVLAFFVGTGAPLAWWLAAAMLLCSLGLAARAAYGACLAGYPLWPGRVLLAWLHWSPAVARQCARWFHAGPTQWHRPLWQSSDAFWSEAGIGRESLLEAVRTASPGEKPARGAREPNQWAPFDLFLPSTVCAHLALLTATEYHERSQRLTRVMLKAFPKRSVLAVLALLGAWVLGQMAAGHWWRFAAGCAGLAGLVVAVHVHTKRALAARSAHLRELASRAGLREIQP